MLVVVLRGSVGSGIDRACFWSYCSCIEWVEGMYRTLTLMTCCLVRSRLNKVTRKADNKATTKQGRVRVRVRKKQGLGLG